jgi:hypothetical protein
MQLCEELQFRFEIAFSALLQPNAIGAPEAAYSVHEPS